MEAFFSARSPEELEAARAAMATRDLAPLDASARERDAWTLLRLPTPLLHPGLAAAAATRLGIARASALQLARCELVRVGARALEPVPDAQQRAEDNARRLARLDPETRSRALRASPDAPFHDARLFAQPPGIDRCGPRALADWLGADGRSFLIDALPIPPSAATPPRPGLDGRPVPADAERALRELLWRASALDDADADAPPDADAIASLQRALERYLHALRPRLFDPPHRAAARPPPPLEVPGPWPEDVGDELGSILACVWARDRIVVQRRRELVWIYPDGEAEQLRFEGAVIGWIDPRLGVCVAATGDGLGVYDLGEDRWLDRFPDRAPRWLFWEDSGRAYLRDGHGRVHPLLEVEGEAAVLETTPDARRLWVEDDAGAGGIFDTETGALVGAPPRPTEWLIDQVPMLTSSGALLRPPTFAADESADVADRWDAAIESLHTAREPASALVVTPRDRCWFLRAGVLLRGDRPHAQIGWPYQAAAFDREGERLALVDDARVIIVDPESITIERRVALPPARFRDP